MTVMVSAVFLVTWTLLGVMYLLTRLGDKHAGRDPWWVYVLTLPAMALALLVGALTNLNK